MATKMFLTEKTIFQNVDYFINGIVINIRLVHRVDRVAGFLYIQSSELGLPTPSPLGECTVYLPPFVPGVGHTVRCLYSSFVHGLNPSN